MHIEFKGDQIHLNRELSKLDRMAVYFSEILRRAGIEHVFVSGYVAIVFGRNRTSEDIDVICVPVSQNIFENFWNSLEEMECIITSDMKSAYSKYLKEGIALRFAYRGEFIPNIEMKFAANDVHREALKGKKTLVLSNHTIPISSFELQIAYKLFLGSEKDIEDARFLFDLFRESLDLNSLKVWIKDFGLNEKESRYYLGWIK